LNWKKSQDFLTRLPLEAFLNEEWFLACQIKDSLVPIFSNYENTVFRWALFFSLEIIKAEK